MCNIMLIQNIVHCVCKVVNIFFPCDAHEPSSANDITVMSRILDKSLASFRRVIEKQEPSTS